VRKSKLGLINYAIELELETAICPDCVKTRFSTKFLQVEEPL